MSAFNPYNLKVEYKIISIYIDLLYIDRSYIFIKLEITVS